MHIACPRVVDDAHAFAEHRFKDIENDRSRSTDSTALFILGCLIERSPADLQPAEFIVRIHHGFGGTKQQIAAGIERAA